MADVENRFAIEISSHEINVIAVCIYRLVMISIKWSETAQKMLWPARM